MKTTNDGGPAFPVTTIGESGMSLRDWFAGQALAGCLAYSFNNPSWGDFHNNGTNETLADHCYGIADAMLKAREAK